MTINELCYYKYAEPWGEDADEEWMQPAPKSRIDWIKTIDLN